MKPGTTKPTSNWKIGNFFSKNAATTPKKEETPGKGSKTDTITSVHWTEKIKGLDTNDKAKVLEAELKAMEEQLKEKSSIIKCLQEIHCGVGLKSSAADFGKIKDKDCQQLIQDTQTLYQELEDFNQTVISDEKSKYDPPVAPVAKLMTTTNLKANGVKSNAPKGTKGGGEGNSKLANIRSNWEERNLKTDMLADKIIDLNNRLKAAYDYINEQKSATARVEGKDITKTNVVKTRSAPMEEEKSEPAPQLVPDGKGVDKKQKDLLLLLAGGDASESEEEDVYKARPARSYVQPPAIEEDSVPTLLQSKVYNETYEGGKKPDWLDEGGEIFITPVQAVLINSLQGKAEKMQETSGRIPSKESVAEPTMYPGASPPKNQAEFNRGSQKIPIEKLGKTKSDVSDIVEDNSKDISRHTTDSYKFYSSSNDQHQQAASRGYQSQMKTGTTAVTYHQEQTATNYQRDNQPQIQPRITTGNVRQSSNGYSSDVD